MSLKDKVALVTGGAQGLGKALAEQLLKSGASVALMDLKEDVGEATCKELRGTYGQDKVTFFMGNVTSQEGFEAVFKSTKDRFGGLDIVINNAGISGEIWPVWERTIDVNVKGTIRGTLLAVDNLRKDKGGRGGVIVNVASVAGINPNPCSPTYCASKSAIIQYSLSWAKNPELAANGVRINVLAPAFIDTNFMSNVSDPECCMLPQFASMAIAMAGIMKVEYVAEAAMELVAEEHGKNGQVLKMVENGGKSYHPVL